MTHYTSRIRDVPIGKKKTLSNTRLGNALREYKKTITLNQMQREVNALRAPLLAWSTTTLHTFPKRQICVAWRCVALRGASLEFEQTIANAHYIQYF